MTRTGILRTTALLLSTIVASFAISECSPVVTRIKACGINHSCWDLELDTCALLASTGSPMQVLRYGHFSWFRSMSAVASVYQRSKDGGLSYGSFCAVPTTESHFVDRCYRICSFNYHLSSTRILVECVFGNIKGRFKVLRGVTDRHEHATNARMICAAAVLHNLLVDIGDKEVFEWNQDAETRKKARLAMNAFAPYWDRTQDEINLGEAKRNAYMKRFYQSDNE